jgi:hypothetical protein
MNLFSITIRRSKKERFSFRTDFSYLISGVRYHIKAKYYRKNLMASSKTDGSIEKHAVSIR